MKAAKTRDVKMDSEIVAHVAAEEAELRTELKPKNEKLMRLQAFLSVYDETAELLSKRKVVDLRAATATPTSGSESDADVLKPDVSQPIPRMRQPEFVALARVTILEYGRPVTEKEILDGFHRKGRRVSNKNEPKNLNRKLSKAKKQIVCIPGSGYWPVDIPCPKVSYTPPRPVVVA